METTRNDFEVGHYFIIVRTVHKIEKHAKGAKVATMANRC